MKKIAVTGSLASGKSTVCELFRELGAYVVSADTLLHDAFSLHSALGREIQQLLGNEVLHSGKIDRSQVAAKVFAEPKLLSRLEDLCHPYVFTKIQEEYRQAFTKGHVLFVAEVPLLFESRYTPLAWFDASIAVVCQKAKARERYLRKGGSEEQFLVREAQQMSMDQKRRLADYILENDGTFEDLSKAVCSLFSLLCREATPHPSSPS